MQALAKYHCILNIELTIWTISLKTTNVSVEFHKHFTQFMWSQCGTVVFVVHLKIVCVPTELVTVMYELTRCPPKGRSSLFSGMLNLMNRIMRHRFLTDCTLLHCNFLEKHDLSTLGCCPGVAGCCFADELLYSVHTEQLPSVYLCVGSSLFSSYMPSICEWEVRAHFQEALCCRRRINPTFRLHVLSHKNE